MNEMPNCHAQAKALKLETRAFIGGRYVDAVTGETFETVNPATGKVITKVAAGGEKDGPT